MRVQVKKRPQTNLHMFFGLAQYVIWAISLNLLKHFQDCDDSGGQLDVSYCSCLFHNYLLTPFEAFRWKVDGSSIVSGITEVKETLMIIVPVKGALHSGALRLCGMNRMNMC